jgi:sulfide:quinone oxidoreductase
MKRTIILGGGFGGIAAATTIQRRVGADHEVLLIDRAEMFMMGLRKLWALVGIGTLEDGQRSRTALDRPGLTFVQTEVEQIDPANRRVVTRTAGTLQGDHLIVALGAESRPDLVPGLAEHGHNVYDPAAIPALATAIAAFTGGRIVIAICGVPYKCPPAPYECAMLLDAHLRERGLRDRTSIDVVTLQPILLPNVGQQGSTWLGDQLSARGIGFSTGKAVRAIENGKLVFEKGEMRFDLLIGVPPHRPPGVVKASGLTGSGEWITVDQQTLRTQTEGVFAIGDCTQITLANGLPFPKAGVIAEAEGDHVGRSIVAELLGQPSPPPFDGRGYCFIEMGPDRATLIEGDFFATPQPLVRLLDADERHAREKRAFETERLTRWFGG